MRKVPKSGGAPVVVGFAPWASTLQPVGDTIHGTHAGEANVWNIPTAGGPTTTLAVIKPGGPSLAVDAGSGDWTDGVASGHRVAH